MRQMRVFVLSLILSGILSLIFVTSVQAQEPTITPTWEPIFKSPTPRPTLNPACPDGQPEGWLTVTPSSRWLMNCEQCIIRPTADWSNIEFTPLAEEYVSHLGFCTTEEEEEGCYNDNVSGGVGCICLGYPTTTPTLSSYVPYPNGTPTPITTSRMYKIKLNDIDFDYVQVQGGTPVNYSTSSCPNNDIFMGWAIDAQFTLYDGGQGYSQMRFNLADVVDGGGDYIYREYFSGTKNWNKCFSASYGGQSTVQIGGVNYHPCENLFPTFEVFQSYGYINLYGGGATKPLTSFSAYRQRAVGNGVLYGMCFGVNEPTATPMPTLNVTATADTGSDYCNVVEAKPAYLADQIGIELPIPRAGVGQCTQIAGWEIGIGWLESILPNLFNFTVPEYIGVPGFILCVHPFTFGTINLLGVLLDMDVLLLLVAYIAVVRWLMRS